MPARPWSIELTTAQVVKPAAAVPPKEPNGDAPQGNHTTKAGQWRGVLQTAGHWSHQQVERWVIWQVVGFDVFIVLVEIDSYSYDSWFFHAWEHLRIILTGFMKEREREWVGMSYFIPCRDCGCMESRNTGTILSLNPFAWCCSWQEATPSKPVSIYEQLKQKDWAQSFYWFASSHATTWSMISRCFISQSAGRRWVPQWAIATAWQEPGPLRWSLVRGWLVQPLTWKQIKWWRGPWYGNLDSDAADGPSSFGVGWCYQTIALGKSIVGETHSDNSELSCDTTCHFDPFHTCPWLNMWWRMTG